MRFGTIMATRRTCPGPKGQPLKVEWEENGTKAVLGPLGASRNVQSR